MIHHHPHDDLLLAHAAGSLDSGHALLVACHAECCAHCQERIRVFESVGGVLLEDLQPATLRAQALADTMAAIAAPVALGGGMRAHGRGVGPELPGPELPAGMPWPQALAVCTAERWRWLGPGMRMSRVTVPLDPAANVFLLRFGAGKKLPMHTHSDSELTLVLHGAFHDGRALFGPGDFDETDATILHQPVVQAGGECICIASVHGRLQFEGAVARILGGLVGI